MDNECKECKKREFGRKREEKKQRTKESMMKSKIWEVRVRKYTRERNAQNNDGGG